MKKIFIAILATSFFLGCGAILPKASVTYECVLYNVHIEGVGTNAKTINALGKHGVFEGGQLTAKMISELAPVLAQYNYRARISANRVIIEPVPRIMLVGIQNGIDQPIKVVIHDEEDRFVWSTDKRGIAGQTGCLLELEAGNYIVYANLIGSKEIQITKIKIQDDDHKRYASLLRQDVDYLLSWP